MFTVKATYRNETRRFSFPESVFFPTYEELHHQLYRIFPISNSYYLSRLIFSPDALKPGRILVGKEVHSAEDYDPHVAPLRRLWPNPLLRFTVFDETLHEVQSGASQRSSLYSAPTIPLSELFSKSSSPAVFCHNGPSPPKPHSFMPPSPLSLRPFPPPPCFSTSNESCSSRQCGTVETARCCSISQGKTDIHVLMSSFKEDLERILYRTLGTGKTDIPPSPSVGSSTCGVSGVNVIPPQTETVVSTSENASSRWCFVCKTSFTGGWYGCVKCPWHVVCPSCFSKSQSPHTLSFGPSHVVQQRSIDCSTQGENNTLNNALQPPTPTSSGPTVEPSPTIHHGIICDSCNRTVVGVRHKCLDCSNYDLCTACTESGATEQHNPFHEFFDIETPGRVYVHTLFSGNRDRSFGNHQQLSNSDHAPATRQGSTPVELIRHSATCDLCDSAIVGERYKCIVCPDFDTCSSCFRITSEQHPNHGFVKVNKPDDLMMRDSLSLRQVAHLAICDSCGKTVRGARYKCMHPGCPDFDLCSDCEAFPIPVHPLNHPMLKLRTPDTIIPTVYRVGQTQSIEEPSIQKPAPVYGQSRPLVLLSPPSPLATPIESPKPEPLAIPGQITNMAPENGTPFSEEFLSPLGSPASDISRVAPILAIAPSHLVDAADSLESPSPQSVRPASVIHHQLWPRINQEMIQLNPAEAEASYSAVNPVEDVIKESVDPESLTAEESLPQSLSGSSVYQAGERPGTCPVSPVPSAKSVVDDYRTPSSILSNNQESHYVVQRPLTGDQQEIVLTSVSQQGGCLDSVLVADTNVPDGQIFPPGAEFVKGWHMINNGALPWPKTTEVQFVAGEMFAPECSTALSAKVGMVYPGQNLDIWTGDLKAPDVPGRYVGYWRLNDGQGHFFGSSVWIDLMVADHHSDQASEQSLAASSMVMPSGQPTNSVNTSDEVQDAPRPSLPSTFTKTVDEVEDPESDVSSVSLVSVPTTEDEDAEWQDTRTHSEPLEYVVLYDSSSEE